MRSGRVAALMAAGLATALLASAPAEPRQSFTRGAHTTRRRINPVDHVPEHPDPEVAAWNRAVEQRKAARRARRT